MFDGPPKMAPAVWGWLKGKLWGHVWAIAEVRIKTDRDLTDQQIVELNLIVREARRHTSRKKALKGTVRQVFDVDLTGWRYLSDVDDPVELLDDLGDRIVVQVSFKDKLGQAGFWDFVGNGTTLGSLAIQAFAPLFGPLQSIEIGSTVGALRQIQAAMADLKDTIRHELEHMGQDLLEEIKDLKERPGIGKKHQGVPSGGDRDDFLTFEFYPRLRDDVMAFKRHLRNVPRRQWRSELDRWSQNEETFLGILYHHERTRWRKAMAEFTKELAKQGVRL